MKAIFRCFQRGCKGNANAPAVRTRAAICPAQARRRRHGGTNAGRDRWLVGGARLIFRAAAPANRRRSMTAADDVKERVKGPGQ